MTFNWTGAFQVLLIFAAPISFLGALLAFDECEMHVGAFFVALFLVDVFILGGVWTEGC